MKTLEFKTSKGEFILEEASDKNLGVVFVKYMTEEQFARVVDSHYSLLLDYKTREYTYQISARESFESLIKSLGWHLFENPYKEYDMSTWHDVSKEKSEAESKTLYNPILLKKK